MEKPSAGDKELRAIKEQRGKLVNFKDIELPDDSEEILDGETFHMDLLSECLMNIPALEDPPNPLTISNIINHQSRDLALNQAIRDMPDSYQHKEMEEYDVICYVKENTWKIVIPQLYSNKHYTGTTLYLDMQAPNGYTTPFGPDFMQITFSKPAWKPFNHVQPSAKDTNRLEERTDTCLRG